MEKLKEYYHRLKILNRISKENNISLLKLIFQTYSLKKKHHFEFINFINYRLYNPGLSKKEILEFVPSHMPTLNDIWETLNPARYRAIFLNKYLFHNFFGRLDIRTPEFYGLFDPHHGFTATGKSLKSIVELENLISSIKSDVIAIKPVEGYQAKMVFVVRKVYEKNRQVLKTLKDEELSVEYIYNKITDKKLLDSNFKSDSLSMKVPVRSFIVQEGIIQHSLLSRVLGPILAPLRIVTLIDKDNITRIIGAKLHILDYRFAVDANYKDVIVAAIDIETGVIGYGYKTKDGNLEPLDTAPGCSLAFQGLKIPHWNELINMAKTSARAFPWCRAIGWDIAVEDSGPVLIEGNERWGFTTIQTPTGKGLLRSELKETLEFLKEESLDN